jgi:cytochrome c peroxidase
MTPRVPSACALLFFAACSGGESESTTEPPAATPAAVAPATPAVEPLLPLDPLEVNMEKAMLGRGLFHDTRLSGDGTISCATCHSLDHGGAEPRRTSTGIRGQVGPINSPTVFNAALNFKQFWDGRAADLEEQAAGPVANPIEMGATWDQVLASLGEDDQFEAAFTAVYADGITQANVTDAIAEYERLLITPSPFDRYLRGETEAISAVAREGYETFKSVGCTACHTGQNVGGTMFQKMGLVRDYFSDRGDPTDADLGRFNVTQAESDRHFFKVPTLRNVALTAPYLHDGSQETLADAVRVMGRYQLGRDLTDAQIGSIVAFLESLTGELPAAARPEATAEAPAAEAAAPTEG